MLVLIISVLSTLLLSALPMMTSQKDRLLRQLWSGGGWMVSPGPHRSRLELRPSDNHRCSETRRFSLFDVAASARLQLLLQRYELPNVWCGRIEFYGALELEQELL